MSHYYNTVEGSQANATEFPMNVFRLKSASEFGSHLPLVCHQHLGDRCLFLNLRISRKGFHHGHVLLLIHIHSATHTKPCEFNGATSLSVLQLSSINVATGGLLKGITLKCCSFLFPDTFSQFVREAAVNTTFHTECHTKC